MNLFCLLWTPLFYLFWSSLVPEDKSSGGILALILGSIVALVFFFLGSFVEPGGLGLSRWFSGFIDMVSVPAVLPLMAYLLLLPLGLSNNFANFALLWLIPDVILRMVGWRDQQEPMLLVLVPLLRTAIVVGIASFMRIMMSERLGAVISAIFGIVALPLLAATSYWAFFSQNNLMGFVLLFITIIPMVFSIILLLYQANKQ
jgi:hypothetical protein